MSEIFRFPVVLEFTIKGIGGWYFFQVRSKKLYRNQYLYYTLALFHLIFL